MNAPLHIKNDLRTHQLVCQWDKGETTSVSHQRLRESCRCATCRMAEVRGHSLASHASVRLMQINLMGYGLQFVFSDGHDRGIFPWPYLYALSTQTDVVTRLD